MTRGEPSILRRRREQAKMLAEIRRRRSRRFRILVCVNGTDPSYVGLDAAARIAGADKCDIILLYVRRIDQGLNSGGLQVRMARQNLLEWGLELPGIQFLKRGFEMLLEKSFLDEDWEEMVDHTNVFGDPLGDNKVEYRTASGKSLVLKLKTAPDVASGVLDQYELGPYNLIIMAWNPVRCRRWRCSRRVRCSPCAGHAMAKAICSAPMAVNRRYARCGAARCWRISPASR
jgi:hypothetical protein